MALRFSSGLLTGLQQYGQGGGVPSDPRQRNAMQAAGVTNPLLQQFGMGLGGMLGTDMRSPAAIAQAKAEEEAKMKELELFGQEASQKAYAAKQAIDLGEYGRKLIKERDLGLLTDADVLNRVETRKATERETTVNSLLNQYEKSLLENNTVRANAIEAGLLRSGVSLEQLDERRKAAKELKPSSVSPTLKNQLGALAASGDIVAKSHLETITTEDASDSQVNSALSYLNTQKKPSDVDYLNENSFNTIEGLQEARQRALQNNDVGIATQLGVMQEEMAAQQVNLNSAKVIELATSVNPNYKEIRNRQLSLDQASALIDLGEGAGVSELIIRSISDIQSSDAKALAAMEKFAKSDSFDARIRSSLNMFVKGELSAGQKEDYKNVITVLNDFYRSELDNTAQQLRATGNAEDSAAAASLLRMNSQFKIY